MIINEESYGGTAVLRPDGRLDQETAEIFQERLLQSVASGRKAVVVDFSKIPYISSVGLRAIMIAAKQSKVDGVSLSVAALTPTVNEIFEISRFNFVVEIFEEVRDAIAAASEESLNLFEAD